MPDPAQARLEAALPAALERLRATSGVYAALWCGSAARGEATAHSDLDFHALVGGDRRWRSNFTVRGVLVEVFHNPARQIRALLVAGDAATVAMFAQGRPALPHPELDALCAEARARYAAGPAPRLMKKTSPPSGDKAAYCTLSFCPSFFCPASKVSCF